MESAVLTKRRDSTHRDRRATLRGSAPCRQQAGAASVAAVIFETALADALYLNWAVPAAGSAAAAGAAALRPRARGRRELRLRLRWCSSARTGLRLARLPLAARCRYPAVQPPALRARRRRRAVGLLPARSWCRPGWCRSRALVGAPAGLRGGLRLPATVGATARRAALDASSAGRPLARRRRDRARRRRRGRGSAPGPRRAAFFRERPRGYVGREQRSAGSTPRHPMAEPVAAAGRAAARRLARGTLPAVDASTWDQPHCAFLIPSARLSFELERATPVAVRMQAAVPG